MIREVERWGSWGDEDGDLAERRRAEWAAETDELLGGGTEKMVALVREHLAGLEWVDMEAERELARRRAEVRSGTLRRSQVSADEGGR